MTKYIVLSLALVTVLVAVSPSVPNAMAHSANVPTGVYTTTLTAADIPDSFPPEYIPVLVGDWEIEFTESGSYIVSKDGYPAVVGRYNSNPARIVMTDLQGPLSCTDEPGIATATYRWTLVGDELILTTVNDLCAGRSLALTAHPLQRQ
ncbi:MAG TPA: hypothetical protein VGJ48_15445 [Pyrinomonadaceae bacterium]|jgi:hypothetical protein